MRWPIRISRRSGAILAVAGLATTGSLLTSGLPEVTCRSTLCVGPGVQSQAH